jgi:GTP-binding protein Era
MNTKTAFVAIVGKPNVGKSSLLNLILGQKIAITSSKPQTTRTKITGVLTKDDIQYVFLDTPGFHQAKNKLSNYMIKSVKDSVCDVDVALLVIEPKGPINKAELELIETIKSRKMPCILVINKTDLVGTEDVLKRIDEVKSLYEFDSIVPISVFKNQQIDVLLKQIKGHVIESVHYFDNDTLTDQPERVIVAELIREKLLQKVHEEIPHGIAVEIEKMKEREDKGIIDIDATIYCEKQSHKGMIIGKNGAMLKTIGSLARHDLERFLDNKVNLKIWVKVKEDWRNKETFIKNFGLN